MDPLKQQSRWIVKDLILTDRADRHGFLTSSAFASGSGSVSTPLKSN
jgi:hypothetical protein